jgi:hypothetical protein
MFRNNLNGFWDFYHGTNLRPRLLHMAHPNYTTNFAAGLLVFTMSQEQLLCTNGPGSGGGVL